MKKNLNNSANSFKSVKAATRKYASIEQEIHSIFESLVSVAPDEEVVRKEKAPKGACCKGFICIYSREDLKGEEEQRSAGWAPKKALPKVRYAFYPATDKLDKIGSVAIYGDESGARLSEIRRRGFLFNHKVIASSIEMGRRPFVDVKLAS